MENRPTRFVFGDVETTGLGKNQGVVEISWIETDAEFNEVARYGSLINPQKPIQFGAMSVHGITEAMVAEAPKKDEPAGGGGMGGGGMGGMGGMDF